MSHYIQVSIADADTATAEILVALLSEQGYEGFEETTPGLMAFVPAAAFDEPLLSEVLAPFGLPYSLQTIEKQNWNAQWESGFEPVVVGSFATVRAGFHPANAAVLYDIVVTPKMSFGTGHHATTYMMIEQMQQVDFTGKTVLDFGTGTGVLAILAEKMGAASVLAIDIDDWSVENALENVQNNDCSRIVVAKAATVPDDGQYAVILANINLNVISDSLSAIAAVCLPDAVVLLSGFLPEDVALLQSLLAQQGFTAAESHQRGSWCCLRTSFRA